MVTHLQKANAPTICHHSERLYTLLSAALETQDSALKEAESLNQKHHEIKEFLKIPGVGIIGALVFDAIFSTFQILKHEPVLF